MMAGASMKFDPEKDYYAVLGISETADLREVERAYRSKARMHHPDSGGSEETMKSLNEARDVLSDPDARKASDEGRAPKRVAYGSSAAFDPEAASKAGTLNIPVANPDFAGPLIAAAFSFFIGLFLLFLVETQWVFFLWPLRFMALGSLFASVLLAHSAMKVKQRGNTRATRSRAASILSEALFWAVSLALLGSIIAALYLI
jgi:curved DNA-binding protein CbpA